MAHGTPDWGLTAGTITTYQLGDLAEHAARLGSIVTHDRRGEIMFVESFAAGLNRWDTAYSGTGGTVDLTVASTRTGLYAARLVGGSDGSRRGEISRYLPYPALSIMGAEFSVRLVSGIDQLDLLYLVDDGSDNVWCQLRLDVAAAKLQYLSAAPAYVDIATGFSLAKVDPLFHTIKLVMDAENRNYHRAIVNEVEYDLADIGAYIAATAGSRAQRVIIRLTGTSGVNGVVYVDDVILTQNEPV